MYAAAVKLISAYRETKRELARQRFTVNFGTSICLNCEGLKAGPGVIATCFQVKLCNFKNIKESEQDPRHLRVLDNLTSGV